MKVQAITTFERKTGRRASTKQWPQWYHSDIFRHLEFISYHSTVLICTYLYSSVLYVLYVRVQVRGDHEQITKHCQTPGGPAGGHPGGQGDFVPDTTLRHFTTLNKSTVLVGLVRFGPIWSDLVHLVSLFSRGCKSCTVFSLCLSIPQLVCPIKASVNRKTTQDRVKAGFILLLLPLVEAC